MTTHASDVAVFIREAIEVCPSVGEPSAFHFEPDPEQSFPNRDGRHEFVVVAQDCFRGFRISVEVLETGEAFRLKDEYDDG